MLNKFSFNQVKLKSNNQSKLNFNFDEDDDNDEEDVVYSSHNEPSMIPFNKTTNSYDQTKREYFFHIDLKNNFNYNKAYEVKFYKKHLNLCKMITNLFKRKSSNDKKDTGKCCFYCFCTVKSKNRSNENNVQQIEENKCSNQQNPQSNELRSSRKTIFILYILAIFYMIPQMFEKKLIKIQVDGMHYVFLTVTQFGETRFFRQLFHLWFYLLFVYIIPFLLIFIFNLLLLRAFLDSKKRCQRYKLKLDPSIILKVIHF